MRGIGLAALVCVSCIDLQEHFSAQVGDVTRGPIAADQTPAARPTRPARTAPLPPISGGTLWVTKAGTTIVAADPENDVVWFTDVASNAIQVVALDTGDEPGRVVEDAAARVHVVLRRAGAIATLQLGPAPSLVARRPVCAEPRGLAYRASDDTLLIACADGQLLTMPAPSGEAKLWQLLPDDLRDVAISGSDVYVSRFRSAQILKLDALGQVTPITLASVTTPDTPFNPAGVAVPQVAWRMIALPTGGVVVSHQSETATPISLTAPGDAGVGGSAYGSGGCGSAVTSTVSKLADGHQEMTVAFTGALPVDLAAGVDGVVSVVSAANAQVGMVDPTFWQGVDGGLGSCFGSFVGSNLPQTPNPVAIAYLPDQTLVLQLRSPAGLKLVARPSIVVFPVGGAEDKGHTLFHAQTPSGLACASCHPEGRDDGHVWQFIPDGARRTQNLTGGLLATAPFHWDGSLPDMGSLMQAVLVGRMGASPPGPDEVTAMANWVNSIPRPAVRPAADPAAAMRGQQLFESADVGCTACHFGPRFTSNLNADVGTGRDFQVPSLTGVVARAPYLHDGCAQTLEDRFVCGGGDLHGHTSQLTPQQLGDLVAYLKTL
jgi:hypothetical protein